MRFFENIGTIIVGLVLCLAVALAVRKIYKDKKNGRHGCGGDCSSCPSGALCNKKEGHAENSAHHKKQ